MTSIVSCFEFVVRIVTQGDMISRSAQPTNLMHVKREPALCFVLKFPAETRTICEYTPNGPPILGK